MKPTIAIKVDIDTLRGYREGVPRLLDLFARRNIQASLFFSFGPDNSGKAIRRIFRKGFIAKMIRTKAPSTYGIKTMLYGTLLPAPMIVASAPEVFRRALDAGHECGVHCWDHVYWQDKLKQLSESSIEREFSKAMELFERLAHRRPTCCAAPGWQVTAHSLAVQQRLGFAYCSDVRGRAPFYPVLHGKRYDVLQIPSTVLTMDECLGLPGITEASFTSYWLRHCDKDWNVITVHAEMEGLSKLDLFERFLIEAESCGFVFAPLSAAIGTVRPEVCEVADGELPGRAGTLALQGSARI